MSRPTYRNKEKLLNHLKVSYEWRIGRALRHLADALPAQATAWLATCWFVGTLPSPTGWVKSIMQNIYIGTEKKTWLREKTCCRYWFSVTSSLLSLYISHFLSPCPTVQVYCLLRSNLVKNSSLGSILYWSTQIFNLSKSMKTTTLNSCIQNRTQAENRQCFPSGVTVGRTRVNALAAPIAAAAAWKTGESLSIFLRAPTIKMKGRYKCCQPNAGLHCPWRFGARWQSKWLQCL